MPSLAQNILSSFASWNVIAGLCLGIFFAILRRIKHKPLRRRSAVVLVLGDIGRSPRMMYHALSFSRHHFLTTLVGYKETAPIRPLLESPYVRIKGIANPPSPLLHLPWIARAPFRIVWQIVSVLKICLWDLEAHPEYIIVQNPPSIPTLGLVRLMALLTGTKVIIDWHNTGYSILAMRVGEETPLCQIARLFEWTFGRTAFAHLFVTKALQEFLVKQWKLKGKSAVLHDRPPSHFRRTEPMIQHELFQRVLSSMEPPPLPPYARSSPTETPFTSINTSNFVTIRPDRPALVVSSTSWTADEDFTPFLTALDAYHQATTERQDLPNLFVIITGKGGLRRAFEKAITKREVVWEKICVRCVFLAVSDYPTLLGCADLGISMHSSSSGRDLPMKVVDMFGCGTPVLAKEFPAIGELVKEGKNGMTWNTGDELGKQMIDLLAGHPNNAGLRKLQEYLTKRTSDASIGHGRRGKGEDWLNWDDNWDQIVYKGVLGHHLSAL